MNKTTFKKVFIYPYKLGSKSAKTLAQNLNTLCLKENGKYAPKAHHVILNWGNSRTPNWNTKIPCKILNDLESIEIAQNKLTTFKIFNSEAISCPEWTTSIDIANSWLKKGNAVIQRNLLESHSGKGIVFVGYDEETSSPIGMLSSAPLYTRYKKKAQEFRVHVFCGEVIDVQEKRKEKEFEGEVNQYIRSHANGWVFCRENIQEPNDLRSLAINAVKTLGLDFGAVDIIYNKLENKCYCLEVNTAPGLEGETINKYVEAIKKCLK